MGYEWAVINVSNYKGIHEKGSGDFSSAVCYTLYTIYISLYTQLRWHLPNPFREFPCISISRDDIMNCSFLANCTLPNSENICGPPLIVGYFITGSINRGGFRVLAREGERGGVGSYFKIPKNRKGTWKYKIDICIVQNRYRDKIDKKDDNFTVFTYSVKISEGGGAPTPLYLPLHVLLSLD